ncbi:MAG: hypothetical protein PHX87_00450 [Candidatus Peribacteraceae bacterium]|nr:hypothetical protein [Candidatus Peribacteraceae bacterium]MDD5741878.1 hypothetical protein [Candidatus Peribacteraceae bacterium]
MEGSQEFFDHHLPPLLGGGDTLLEMTKEALCAHIVTILAAENEALGNSVAFCARLTRQQVFDRAAFMEIPLRELIPFPPFSADVIAAGMHEWYRRGCAASHGHVAVGVHETDGEGVVARPDGSSAFMFAGGVLEVGTIDPSEREMVRLMLSFDALDKICLPPLSPIAMQQAQLLRIRQKLRERFGL